MHCKIQYFCRALVNYFILSDLHFHQAIVNAMDRRDSRSMAEIVLCIWRSEFPEFSTVGNVAKILFNMGHPDAVTFLKPWISLQYFVCYDYECWFDMVPQIILLPYAFKAFRYSYDTCCFTVAFWKCLILFKSFEFYFFFMSLSFFVLCYGFSHYEIIDYFSVKFFTELRTIYFSLEENKNYVFRFKNKINKNMNKTYKTSPILFTFTSIPPAAPGNLLLA